MSRQFNKTATTASSLSQSCKSIGGGGGNSSAVIAGGGTRRTPSPQLLQTQDHILPKQNIQTSQIQNNNKSAYSRGLQQEDHLPNPLSRESSLVKSASANFEDMAGDIRLVDGKKPRKLWTLRDRSAMSVHLLKANLAEDGCEEAQLDVAKKLLQDSADPTLDTVQRENSRLAIYWLIKSSEQGNEEATRLLKECLSSGLGITGQNILDVKTCISTPTNEKLTFKAARLLHLKLNNGEEFITTTQLEARINESRKRKDATKDATTSRQESPNDSYNETDESTITESGKGSREGSVCGDRMENQKPELNTTFTYDAKPTEDATHSNDIYSNPWLSNSERLSPQGGVKLTINDLLKVAGSFNSGNRPRPTICSEKKELSRHNWGFLCQLNAFIAQLLILAALSGTIKLNYCCIYSAVWLSVWASYNVLIWRKRYSNFQDWSDAFKGVLTDRPWSDEKPERRLILKFLIPYLTCIFGSLVLITCFSGLYLLKAMTGILVMFSIFKGALGCKCPNWRIMLIFAVASTPDGIWKLLAHLDSQLNINISQTATGWKDDLITQLGIYVNVPSNDILILTLQIVLALSLVWRRRNNLLRESLSEIVLAFWFFEVVQISSELSREEMYITCAACTILILTFFVLESKIVAWKAAIVIAGSAILVLSGLCVSVKPESLQRMLVGSDRFVHPSNTLLYGNIDNLNHVSWDDYNANCHRLAWRVMSPAETQLKCFLKYGAVAPTAVRWIGKLSLVKVRDIRRGKRKDSVEDVTFDLSVNILTSEGSEMTWQSYLPGSDNNQHAVPATILVSTTLLSSSKEKQDLIDYILGLRTGDRLEFHGLLNKDAVGSLKPEIVSVQSLKCLGCAILDNYVEYFLKSDVKELPKESGESDYMSLFKSYWKFVESHW